MTIKLAMLMDPIENIDRLHDSSFLIYLAAQRIGWQLFYFQQQDLFIDNGIVQAKSQEITVYDMEKYYSPGTQTIKPLSDFDLVLMRKDPPFNIEYIYTTYLLELAEQQGTKVFNRPQSLRDANEKMFTLWFPDLCPKTLVSSDKEIIKHFWRQQKEIILKPLDGMGGRGIFYARKDELNINSIIETLTQQGRVPIMVQEYLPEIISDGDHRIIVVDGEPASHVLVRKPANEDVRGNMIANASITIVPLTAQEKKLCAQIAPVLKEKGLLFVGLDVIGGKITEINVTSPTGAQEINRGTNLDIGSQVIDALIKKLRL